MGEYSPFLPPSVFNIQKFDICDGERHFACTVPLRARTCPPLLNAIYTASARHLSRIKKYWRGNQVHYGGKVLPNLTPETAIHYHNQCIAHFVSLSDHSREAQDENLLAAAVILRFYEEVDRQSFPHRPLPPTNHPQSQRWAKTLETPSEE